MNKSFTSLLAVILSFVFAANGVAGSGGSSYSRYGIGDIRFFYGSRSAAMGGTTIALLSPTSFNRLNPAGESRLTRTMFTGTFSYEGFRMSNGTQSAYLGAGSFGGAFLAFPISPSNGVALSFGVTPYSNVNYKIESDSKFDLQDYSQLYFGEGGISTALAGLSFAPADSLHLGLRLNYIFGQIRAGSDVTVSSSGFVSAKYRRTTNANGFNVGIGLIYTGLGRLLGLQSLNGLNIAASLFTGTNLDATQQNINITSIGQDTVATQDGKIKIPVSGGFGFSWLMGNKYLVAGDLYHQQWSDLQIYGTHPAQIRNSTRVSLGIEIRPSGESPSSYWNRVAYRFGAYYLASYYQIGSESINEAALTAGLGLPIGGDSGIDFAVQYGQRGTLDNQLLKDKIVRFSITLNVGERWFVRTQEE